MRVPAHKFHVTPKDSILCDYVSLLNIKTHGSESRGQEEAGLRDEPVSCLQVALL